MLTVRVTSTTELWSDTAHSPEIKEKLYYKRTFICELSPNLFVINKLHELQIKSVKIKLTRLEICGEVHRKCWFENLNKTDNLEPRCKQEDTVKMDHGEIQCN